MEIQTQIRKHDIVIKNIIVLLLLRMTPEDFK